MDNIIVTPLDNTEPIDINTGEILSSYSIGECPDGIDKTLWEMWHDEEASKQDQFLSQLRRGMQGHNIGLDNGLTQINKYLYGTHKGRYYLLGGESGAGKTTLGDFMFVLKAWESAKKQKRPIKIFYCSFEIGKTEKLYRWCSYFIFVKYGLRLPSDYLQGRIHGKLITKEHSRLILEAYSTITEMLKDVEILEHVTHPTNIFESLVSNHFEKHGTVERTKVSEADQKKGKKGYVKGYTENNTDLITILMIDHLALTGSELHLETKGTMDKMSKYAIVLRNIFHCTIGYYQQFSTDMMSTYRGMLGKKTEATIAPQRIDFGDSRATYRDADVVLGAVKPQADLSKFMGYDLSKSEGLGECFLANYIMKNRYGPAAKMLPLFMDGSTGFIYDLPLQPNNMIAMQPWYDKAQEIEKLCQVYYPQSL